ncbi:hypothetical protein FRB99_007845 [Tulasnella sp. 403]|nr:hypothetical protein FRB99_007845 [Tulasnella sp. 403]
MLGGLLPRRFPRAITLSSRSISSSALLLSGHNRWSKIHRGKAVEDRKKSQRFSKAVNEIIAAARKGGTDPTTNYLLAVALRNARSLDVPKDNITAALAKASGPQQAEESRTACTYEAMGPGNFPLIIESVADNPARAAKNVKRILKDRGGRVAPVAYAFKQIGKLVVRPRQGATYEEIWEHAVNAGAQDLNGEFHQENQQETELEVGEISDRRSPSHVLTTSYRTKVITEPSDLKSVSLALVSPPCEHIILESGFEYVPADADAPEPELSEEEETKLERLCRELCEDPDVDQIWTLRGRYEAE